MVALAIGGASLLLWALIRGCSTGLSGGRALSGYRPGAERAVVHPGQPPDHDPIFIDAVDYCFRPPYTAEHMRTWDRAQEQLDMLGQGLLSPEQACRNFAKIFNDSFAEFKPKRQNAGRDLR
mgnify:FL=1